MIETVTEQSKWLAHTAMTAPAEFGSRIEALPSDVASLAGVVQGLLVHCDCLGLYDIDPAAVGSFDRSTLPVRDRLDRLTARGGRDFALLLTSFLRTHGVPARCRCGFASYLGAGWADHWVCEYWHQEEAAWRLADAQIDRLLRKELGVTFDALDMSRDAFLPANEAWSACRSERLSPDLFGHGETKGLWFMSVNVARDSLSLNGREISTWDTWRDAVLEQRHVADDDLPALDALAEHPERAIAALTPPWLNQISPA